MHPGTGHRSRVALREHLTRLTPVATVPVLLEPPAPPSPWIGEKAFQALVVDLAERFGWYVWHDEDPRRNLAGWPDLVLIRERVLFRELKTVKGKVRPEQAALGQRLLAAGADWGIWRPQDWGDVVTVVTEVAG